MSEYKNGFEVGLAAGMAAAGATEWRLVETAPHDELLLLGWWQKWPELHWEQAVALARCTRSGWQHGCATHWQTLPGPPITSRQEPQMTQNSDGTTTWTDNSGSETR